jgi:hypothetical protein
MEIRKYVELDSNEDMVHKHLIEKMRNIAFSFILGKKD